MNDTQKYLFDLQGFLVVEGVLSKAEVAAANEAIERHADGIVERVGEASLSSDSKTMQGETGRGDLGGLLSWEKPWCDPFRAMLAHPQITPYLNQLLGKGWRLDHNAGLISMRKGAEGFLLHGSSGPAFDRPSTTSSRTVRCTTVSPSSPGNWRTSIQVTAAWP